MHILLFHQFYTGKGEAGISRFNIFAEYWKKRGVKLTVVSGSVNYITGERVSRGLLFWKEKYDNVEIVRVWSSSLGFGYRSFIGRIFSYGTFLVSSLIVGLSLPGHNLVMASAPPVFIGIVANLVSKLKHIPFVFEVRDMWPDDAIELGFIKNPLIIRLSYAIEKWLYESAALVATNSPGIKKFLMEKKSLSENKVGVIENPVEIKKVDDALALRTSLGWDGKIVFIYTGSHSFVYDFDSILDVAGEMNDGQTLFAFMGDGRQKPRITERIKRENISNVVLLDPVPASEVQRYVQAADVGIAVLKGLARLRFVYATKVFDYMAGKLPIVLAMEGVTAELVEKSESGLVIPSENRGLLKEAFEKMKNPEARKQWGENGFKYLNENYKAEDLAERYLELLKPVVVPQGERN